MKSRLIILLLITIAVASCNDPELTERNRLMGEWTNLVAPANPPIIISEDKIVVSESLVYDYKFVEEGVLYIKTTLWRPNYDTGDSTEYIREDISNYSFMHDTLKLTGILPSGSYVPETPNWSFALLKKVKK